MGKRLNIGVDVDGVLGDFTGAARKLLKEMFNKPDDSLVQTSWAFDTLGITKEEENKMWRKIDSIPNWWLNHKAMSDTDLLFPLCEKHRVVFITNRKDGTGWPIEDQTKVWLKRFFGLLYANVIISDNKGPVARGLNLDYFIDDRPKNVGEVLEDSPGTHTYLLDTTYNQEFKESWTADFRPPVPVKRVYSFNEFAKIILGDS